MNTIIRAGWLAVVALLVALVAACGNTAFEPRLLTAEERERVEAIGVISVDSGYNSQVAALLEAGYRPISLVDQQVPRTGRVASLVAFRLCLPGQPIESCAGEQSPEVRLRFDNIETQAFSIGGLDGITDYRMAVGDAILVCVPERAFQANSWTVSAPVLGRVFAAFTDSGGQPLSGSRAIDMSGNPALAGYEQPLVDWTCEAQTEEV